MNRKIIKTPQILAEEIIDRVESVPWPLECYLYHHPDGTDVTTYKTQTAEAERQRKINTAFLIGTYKKGCRIQDVFADILHTYESSYGHRKAS